MSNKKLADEERAKKVQAEAERLVKVNERLIAIQKAPVDKVALQIFNAQINKMGLNHNRGTVDAWMTDSFEAAEKFRKQSYERAEKL